MERRFGLSSGTQIHGVSPCLVTPLGSVPVPRTWDGRSQLKVGGTAVRSHPGTLTPGAPTKTVLYGAPSPSGPPDGAYRTPPETFLRPCTSAVGVAGRGSPIGTGHSPSRSGTVTKLGIVLIVFRTGAGEGAEVMRPPERIARDPHRPGEKSGIWKRFYPTFLAIAIVVISEILLGWMHSLGDVVADFFRPGEPVVASVFSVELRDPREDLLLLDAGSDGDLDQLETLRGFQRQQWFDERDAIIAGPRVARIEVKGNRRNPVRIVAARPSSECSRPSGGTYFINRDGRGGAPESIGLVLSLDSPSDEPLTAHPDRPWDLVPFFDSQTITLEDNEREQLVFTILPTRDGSLCETVIELDVLVDGEIKTQTISDDGEPMPVLGVQSTAEISQLEMYEGWCWRPVPFTPGDMEGYGGCGDPSNMKLP